MGANLFLAALNPAEMAIGTKSDDKAAIGAAVALEIQAGGISFEKPGSKAVAVEFVMIATRTTFGPQPGKIFALLKNILEKDRNKIYHGAHCWWGNAPGSKRGGELVRTLRPLYFQAQKKDLLRRSR
jgi:hypothetical protein